MVSLAVCLTLLTPLIAGIVVRLIESRMPETDLYWRSSAPGVDMLGYFVPNPMHPWFGTVTRSWLATDVGFPEFVASFSLGGLIVIAAGAAMRVLPRAWVAFTAIFALLSAGPFLHVAGVNTHVPGLWAFLRYVPIIGLARSPSRFAVLAVLGLSILFACSLAAVLRRVRPVFVAALLLVLMLELVPAPRVLYSAEVPDVYKLIAATNDEAGRVLEIPTGVRDGVSSIGKIDAASQYFQTRHHRPMVGGYVSRVSKWRMGENRGSPVLGAIFEFSEGRTPGKDLLARARAGRDAFLRRTCVRFVLVKKRRASEELQRFAREGLKLTPVHEDADYQLLTPVDPPTCSPRRRRGYRIRAEPRS
jgi:hypothetical protein